MRAPTTVRKANNKTARNRHREKTPAAETQVCYTLRYANLRGEGTEARNERCKRHNNNHTVRCNPESTPTAARTSPARIESKHHETRKVCESNKGGRATKRNAQHAKTQKTHQTTKHMQERRARGRRTAKRYDHAHTYERPQAQ